MRSFLVAVFLLASSVSGVVFAFDLPKNLATGDLIWVNSDCGDFCKAIIDSTKAQFGVGPDVNHIGLVEVVGKEVFILEAVPGAGTRRTRFQDLLKRIQSQRSSKKLSQRVFFGFIQAQYRQIFVNAVHDAKTQLGWPYNDLFKFESGRARYCSQWVQLLVQGRNRGQPLWTWRPMQFKGGQWEDYFKNRSAEIPEGELGVSPLGMHVEGNGKIFN